ncbi:hypothetical protein PENSPDRAFT_32404 [Peniophora sp. CONT]|nr:hypothetical protein PENSPDRAFT_32404 [Peniophora sp. CONT]
MQRARRTGSTRRRPAVAERQKRARLSSILTTFINRYLEMIFYRTLQTPVCLLANVCYDIFVGRWTQYPQTWRTLGIVHGGTLRVSRVHTGAPPSSVTKGLIHNLSWISIYIHADEPTFSRHCTQHCMIIDTALLSTRAHSLTRSHLLMPCSRAMSSPSWNKHKNPRSLIVRLGPMNFRRSRTFADIVNVLASARKHARGTAAITHCTCGNAR